MDELGIPEPNDSVELSASQVEQLWDSCGGKERACEGKRRALELMLTEASPHACSQGRDEGGASVDAEVVERAKPRLAPASHLGLARWLQMHASTG